MACGHKEFAPSTGRAVGHPAHNHDQVATAKFMLYLLLAQSDEFDWYGQCGSVLISRHKISDLNNRQESPISFYFPTLIVLDIHRDFLHYTLFKKEDDKRTTK
ncbi:hypothetical protein OUZ56_027468 [Daphnia magna]|uniref:Uncharacterized protein n=1 Tax=Daphnia magna TaxID=35525 RepID=A0ABQ9ZPW8_9CRUS|nr:hypothetical protein OUZ56_027468 [Daphnia magna]